MTFSYREGQPAVLSNLTLKVRPGEYVAVVGKTGCGKSTLMRLLLGFEHPQRGAVYYDGHDLASVDAGSIRKRIGVVLQDGKLFLGSIYDNIAISAPGLTQEEAWEAAELAGIATISAPCPWVCTPCSPRAAAVFPAVSASAS